MSEVDGTTAGGPRVPGPPDGPAEHRDPPRPGDPPDLDEVALALTRLDDDVAAGRVDLVEYWRRRATIEAGASALSPVAARPPDAAASELSVGAPVLVPAAPHPLPPREAAPWAGPAASTPQDHAGAGERNTERPAAHAPFAPPEGAVRLDRVSGPAPDRRGRRWWRRSR